MEEKVILNYLKKEESYICPICGNSITEEDLIEKINEFPRIKKLIFHLIENGKKSLAEL